MILIDSIIEKIHKLESEGAKTAVSYWKRKLEAEVIKVMNAKGYKTSTFEEFDKDCAKMRIGTEAINQYAVCDYNFNTFLKDSTNGKFYIVRLTKGLEVRTWVI